MKQKSVYSPSRQAIYPAEFYSYYEAAGVWPTDGIEISDEDAAKFNGGNEPSGKMVSMVEGKLCWIDRPAPVLTPEELIERAEQQRQMLIDEAMQSISVIQLKLQAGRTLKAAETAKLNATLDYIDAVTETDSSTAPHIEWPSKPEL